MPFHFYMVFYMVLQDHDQVNTEPIKMKWEEELGLEISGEIWEGALQFVNKCTLKLRVLLRVLNCIKWCLAFNARHHLIQFKIIHRLHYSKVKLSKNYQDLSSICDKSTTQKPIYCTVLFCVQDYQIRFRLEIFFLFLQKF